MDIDENMVQAGTELTAVALRNTASIIFDRVRKIKSNKDLKEQNTELQEIIQDLLDDKSELLRIAKIYEEELGTQKITDEDILYITGNLIPILRSFIPEEQRELAAQLEKAFSKETLTILQLIGFNYKKAIGEPLTQYVRNAIESKINPASTNSKTDQDETLKSMIELSKDPESYERFRQLASLGEKSNSQENANE